MHRSNFTSEPDPGLIPEQHPVRPKRRTFYSVQVLRGFAATMVVGLHAASSLSGQGGFRSLPNLMIGNAGVDLFFVISGFVMIWATRNQWQRENAWSDFLKKRVARILPLYWLLTTVKLVVIFIAPFLFRGAQPSAGDIMSSFLLLPAWDSARNVRIIIVSGWTLCFEMFFYYVVAACLAVHRRPAFLATPLLCALALIGMFRPADWGSAALLIDPLLLEFVAGMWIAELAIRGRLPQRIPSIIGMILLGTLIWLASSSLSEDAAYSMRVLVWGLPAMLIVCALIALETKINFGKTGLLLVIGDASYSIYLGHAFILQPLVLRARRMALPSAGEYAVLAGLVAIALIFGVFMWWSVERKLTAATLAVLRKHWNRVRSSVLHRRS